MKHFQSHLALLAALTCLSLFLRGYNYSIRYDDDVVRLPAEEHRSLRLDPFLDGRDNSTHAISTTMTVYLTGFNRNYYNPAHSVFLTDILPRYGSGRFDFDIQEHAKCDASCNSPPVLDTAPCLVVSDGSHKCNTRHIRCNYPRCMKMVTNDERCRFSYGYEVREYFSANLPGISYLPLGPRVDSWKSFQILQLKPDFHISPASKRRYAFNAIFTQATNVGRQELAKIIESGREGSELTIFANMAEKWSSKLNDPTTEQLNTDSYMDALLDSVFTLAPAGHNPECFRLFEAVEAGSIPVLVRDDLYSTKKKTNNCKDALSQWHDAPVLVLESWGELYLTVEGLMGDPGALDEMQARLRLWYDDFMHGIVKEFEENMFSAYIDSEGAPETQS